MLDWSPRAVPCPPFVVSGSLVSLIGMSVAAPHHPARMYMLVCIVPNGREQRLPRGVCSAHRRTPYLEMYFRFARRTARPDSAPDPTALLAAARAATRVPGIVLTYERFILLYFVSATAATFAPAYLVLRMLHTATGVYAIGVAAGGLVVCAMVPLLRFVYGVKLRPLRTSLGSFDDLLARRTALRCAVESAARAERLATRLHVEDQLAEWGSCSALDDGVEELVDAWRTMWMELRCPAAVSGSYPPAVLGYVQHVEQVFVAAMQPDVIASAVSRLLRTYVEKSGTVHWRKGKPGLYDSAFVGVVLRFSCHSNLDWAMLHAWHLAGSDLLAATRKVDRTLDADDLTESTHAVFLSWWNTPRESRDAHLPYDLVLLRAPVHVLAVRALELEKDDATYPVSLTLAPFTPVDDAPIEYVARLWQVAANTANTMRPNLDRIVAAARRLVARPVPVVR